MTTGERIKYLRMRRGWSALKLADLVGCSEKSIRGYEHGEHDPSVHILKKLAACFNISVDRLVGQVSQDNFSTEILRLKSNRFEQTKYYFQVHIVNSGKTDFWGAKTICDGDYGAFEERVLESFELGVNLEDNLDNSQIIINSEEDIDIFILAGGAAFIKSDLLKRCLPHLDVAFFKRKANCCHME